MPCGTAFHKPVARSFTSTTVFVATGLIVSGVMLTAALSSDGVVTPEESVTLAVALTAPSLGKSPAVKPRSVGVTVNVVSPTGLGIVRVMSPTLTVTEVAFGSMFVIIMFLARPP